MAVGIFTQTTASRGSLATLINKFIRKPIQVRDKEAWVQITPHSALQLHPIPHEGIAVPVHCGTVEELPMGRAGPGVAGPARVSQGGGGTPAVFPGATRGQVAIANRSRRPRTGSAALGRPGAPGINL